MKSSLSILGVAGIIAIGGVAAAGCEKSEARRKEDYRAAISAALKEVEADYTLFRTMRANLGAPSPRCTAPPPSGLMRISTNRLKVLTGDESKDGWAVADDPVPDEPTAFWDDASQRGIAPPNEAMYDGSKLYGKTPPVEDMIANKKAAIAAGHAAVSAAPGFLVQAVDEYRKAVVGHKDTFRPGSIKGRIIHFHKDGKPNCHYPYAASNAGYVDVWSRQEGGDRALRADLIVQMRKSIFDAYAEHAPGR